jgi:hypothetical protein
MFVEFRFFRQLKTACPQPMRETIRGFSRYKETVESLPGLERPKVEDVAKYIFDSFRPGCIPMLSVKLVGHADTDLQRGHTFERDISLKRAINVEEYLREKVAALSKDFKAAPSAPVPADIRWSHLGVGAAEPAPENAGKNPNSLGEAERKLNRRVEIFIEPRMPSQPDTPWTFDPTDAKTKLQNTIDIWWKPPPSPKPPPPPPQLPDWFWRDLPKLDDEQNWEKWRGAVKDWCERNHVDPDPIMDTFKNILQLPDGSPGPIDADFEKELRRRRVLAPGPRPEPEP